MQRPNEQRQRLSGWAKNRSKCKGFQEILWNILGDNIGPIANAFQQKDGI